MTTPNSPRKQFPALPSAPNLEIEQERAKNLVSESVLGRSDALETAFHAEARRRGELRAGGAGAALQLPEAQLMIAREYGFTSWRRLSEYYATWQQHVLAGPTGWDLSRASVDNEVARFLEAPGLVPEDPQAPDTHPAPILLRPLTQAQLAAIAAFIPRFYGLSDAEIHDGGLTEAEARLIVARLRRFPSWQTLQERIEELERCSKNPNDSGAPPGTDEAKQAIRNRDGNALVRVFEMHPECFYQPPPSDSLRIGPLWEIVRQFMLVGDPATRGLLGRLASAGLNVQQYLNSDLLGGPQLFRVRTEETKALLELGADPQWIPPSGASVLEHAIVRYMNGEGVDLIAARVRPRKAFWIAAGLGDVVTMHTFLNKRGQLTDAARRDRPDSLMLGVLPELTRAQRPDATDAEILSEAYFVAGLNGRLAAMQELLDLGAPIDFAPGRFPLLYFALANDDADLVDFLLARGADPDFTSAAGVDSARDIAIRMNTDINRLQKAARTRVPPSR